LQKNRVVWIGVSQNPTQLAFDCASLLNSPQLATQLRPVSLDSKPENAIRTIPSEFEISFWGGIFQNSECFLELPVPFKSKAQRRKLAEVLVKGEITPQQFEEWNRETGSCRAAGARGAQEAREVSPEWR